MSSSQLGEHDVNYQRFNNDTNQPLDQEITNGSNRQYGSMLSSPSSGSHVRSSFGNANNANQLNYKCEASQTESMTENTVFTTCDVHWKMHWEMNCREAAIYLEEGRNNEKFDSHPRHPEDMPAYFLVHNSWYNGLDLLISLILLSLAFVEEPALPLFKVPVWVHGSVELLALITIGVQLTLKLRWTGWAPMLKHKRTMLKCITLAIMFLEAMTVLVRQSSHVRVTRALRPIFLIDTKYCGGVRRFVRQILFTLPPILDMLGLLFFLIIIYTVLGYYMFCEINGHFATMQDSFVSLFVLLTTANFPDVMMPSYSQNKWYAIYFVSYLCTMLYVMMNLMLAVVNETFTSCERDKFKKLFLHKRKACQHAFELLVSKQNPDKIRFRQFEGLMRYYAPNKSICDIVLMFCHMNKTGNGALNCEEFLSIYDANTLQWSLQYSDVPWYRTLWWPLQTLCKGANAMIKWSYFETLVYMIIIGNCIAMIIRIFEPSNCLEKSVHAFAACWDTLLFAELFIAEAFIKVLALGVQSYLSSGWNLFDFGTTVMTSIAMCALMIFPSATFLVLFRPLRTLRLFKIKKRYRDVFGTLVILFSQMCSTAIVMLVLYYFFAIIGMELFAGYDMRDCCQDTPIKDFYRYSVNDSSELGYYYLNTFDNLMASSITLFELTVVNNWYVQMDAYAFTAGMYTRIYFMIFYLVTMIVLTIVVSSFLEAFRFRIQYKKSTSKHDEEKMLHEKVELKWNELQCIIEDFQILEDLRNSLVVGGSTFFIGSRPRTREVLQRKMYTYEINEWIAEAKSEEKQLTPNVTHNVEDGSNDGGISDTDHLILNGNLRHQENDNIPTQ
ncbi:Two pore calcium channel protein 1 [Trachymyrmex septentrionalis]|uniref:Two pore calcium channel protein 1 n=1 Tax=Trachymyrmex septentrionalis TaxID=34720 RepID=A0A195FRV6_9HYME|nr:PREDICTED: two pore calcium channel protein 1-like [Trachymyrmex septentrionalis]XP_018337654.1 PREDICTED: two pore calcium channel protein 1-like [Trachymyrmex septentrionalis]KYN42644.1 Two pore calcium channel protein 1 [Trachymyrmex septentrionalis]